jgi:anaerobic C4-dicarboxylate transporter
LWGGVGTLVLVFLFGLDPGEPPISAMLIIVAVISAAAAMQAAGGIDYMVLIAGKALRARPKMLNFFAPYISYLLTILTGTGNTFFSLIPVINELATRTRSGRSAHSPARPSPRPSVSRRVRSRRRWQPCCRSSRSTTSTSSTCC